MTKNQLLQSVNYFAELLEIKPSVDKMFENNVGLIRIVEVIILNMFVNNKNMFEHEQHIELLNYYSGVKKDGYYEFI